MPTIGTVDPGAPPGGPGADPAAVSTDLGTGCGCCDGSPCRTDCTSLLPPTLYVTPSKIHTADCPCVPDAWKFLSQINGKSAPVVYNNPIFSGPTDYWSFFPALPTGCPRPRPNGYYDPGCAPTDPFWVLGNFFTPGDDPALGPRKWWVSGAAFGCFLVTNGSTTAPLLLAQYFVRGSWQLNIPAWQQNFATGLDLGVYNALSVPPRTNYDLSAQVTTEDCVTPDLICDGCSVGGETGGVFTPVACASNARLEVTG